MPPIPKTPISESPKPTSPFSKRSDVIPGRSLAAHPLDDSFTNRQPTATEMKLSRKRSAFIDKELRDEAGRIKRDQGHEVILLGTSDSGKSTMMRQIALIHGTGFTATEREVYKSGIFNLLRQNSARLFQAGLANGIKIENLEVIV